MKNLEKRSIVLSLLLLLCCFSFPAWGQEGKIDLKFEGDSLSADIRQATLKSIFAKLEKEKGIWVKSDPSLLETRVSTKFKDLPVEDGVKEILSHMSFAMFFNKQKELAGINILGSLGPDGQTASLAPPPPEVISPEDAKMAEDIRSFKPIPDMPPPDNPDLKPLDTTVIFGCPPPGEGQKSVGKTSP